MKNVYFKFKYSQKLELDMERMKSHLALTFYTKQICNNTCTNDTFICKTAPQLNIIIIALYNIWYQLTTYDNLKTVITIIYEFTKQSTNIQFDANINTFKILKESSNISNTNNFSINSIFKNNLNHFLEYDKIESILFNQYLLLNNARYFD